MVANAPNRQVDHLRRHLQAAIDRAPQRLGLHHRQAQVVPRVLPCGPIIPAAVFALRARDQLQRCIEHAIQLPILARPHAVRLPQHKRRQPVVVHVALRIRDVQQPRRPAAARNKFQRLIELPSILPPPRRLPR